MMQRVLDAGLMLLKQKSHCFFHTFKQNRCGGHGCMATEVDLSSGREPPQVEVSELNKGIAADAGPRPDWLNKGSF